MVLICCAWCLLRVTPPSICTLFAASVDGNHPTIDACTHSLLLSRHIARANTSNKNLARSCGICTWRAMASASVVSRGCARHWVAAAACSASILAGAACEDHLWHTIHPCTVRGSACATRPSAAPCTFENERTCCQGTNKRSCQRLACAPRRFALPLFPKTPLATLFPL